MSSTRRSRHTYLLTIVVTAATVAIATQAVAAIGAIPSDGRFTACYQTSENVLDRIVILADVGEQCPPTYASVTWPAQTSGGATGPPGPTGPQGSQGPPGPSGSAGVFGQVTVASRTVDVRRGQRASVRCKLGETALSGGYSVESTSSGQDLAVGSFPVANKGGRPVGWAVVGRRDIRITGFQSATSFAGSLYVTRQQRHNHQVFWRGDGTQQKVLVPQVMARGDLDKWPIAIKVYAICARR